MGRVFFDFESAHVVIPFQLWSCCFFIFPIRCLQYRGCSCVCPAVCKLHFCLIRPLKLAASFLENSPTKYKIRSVDWVNPYKFLAFYHFWYLWQDLNFLMKKPIRYTSRQWPLDNCPHFLRSDTKMAASIAALYDDGTLQSKGRCHHLQRHHFGHGEALADLGGFQTLFFVR